MSIHVALYHKTEYTYDQPVGHGPHVVRLRPAPHCRTKILSYSQQVTGGEHFINWQQDPFSNWNARLVFQEKMRKFSVQIELVAEMAVHNPFDFFLEDQATHFPFSYEPALKKDLRPFLEPGPRTPKLSAFLEMLKREILGRPEALTPAAPHPSGVYQGGYFPAAGSLVETLEMPPVVAANPESLRTIDFVVALNRCLQRDIKYLIRLEPGVQSPEETLTRASGSCRDTAWLLVQLARHFGLAARFVSGYLIQLPPDVRSLDGPSGPNADFTDLHAWCEVFLPGAGWIGLDPTSGLLAGEGHIPLACSPDPSSAAPVTGALEECETEFEHRMSVARIWEAPRVTLPYSDAQWTAIEALGHRVDQDLRRHDVRLTQGGEPTFVSIDDRDGDEWNTDAMGPTKRLLSADLMEKLRAKYGEGGLLHYGQGKWYPGEQLPRWSLNLFWRKDGEPVWGHPELYASEHRGYEVTEVQAKRF